MSYEPTVWKSGDVVTSAKLNKLEQGVAGGGTCGLMVVNATYNEQDGEYSADKTYAEIVAHISVGGYVVLRKCDGTPLEDEPLDLWYPMSGWDRDANGSGFITFGFAQSWGNNVEMSQFTINSSDAVTYEGYTYPES